MAHIFRSLYCLVFAKSARENTSAACATATRPVKSLWPIISIGFFAFLSSFPNRYAPVAASTPPCRSSKSAWGTRNSVNRTHALSRSDPVVFAPMSPTVTPSFNDPSFSRSRARKPCGPTRTPPVVTSATTTAHSAVRPCEIQFFTAPSLGEFRTNVRVAGSYVAVVFTTSPEFTPASRSVRQKHPSSPAAWTASSRRRCAGPPSATTVPANRLNCTVNRIQNPGPCAGACAARSLCARKNRRGSSRMSVNRSDARRTISRRKSADCAYVTPFERRREISLANPRAQGVLASSLEATAEVGPPAGAAGTHVPGTIAFSCFPTCRDLT